MYQPPAFREEHIEILHALMRAQPLATLVCAGPGALEANHLPLLLNDGGSKLGRLSGHFSKANALLKALENAGNALPVLAIFHRAQHYISPGWYPSKKHDGKAVPTWNYAVVHAHGVLCPMVDARALRGDLGEILDFKLASFRCWWQTVRP